MALPGECVNTTQTICTECGAELPIRVLRSAAGYYIGFLCKKCGPYGRESGYYNSKEEAETALNSGCFGR